MQHAGMGSGLDDRNAQQAAMLTAHDIRRSIKEAAGGTSIRGAWVGSRRAVAFASMSPAFLIIGAQRCGTSSLYKYLRSHPSVKGPVRKEVGYFSRHYRRGHRWYRAHFPMLPSRHHVTFEATPEYLLHPHAPARVAKVLPDAKIIVLLRDPVRRAHSHYRHMVRRGLEPLTFEEALYAEEQRLGSDRDRMLEDPLYDSACYWRYSYAERGFYADQLSRWMRYFVRDQILVLHSHVLFADPAAVYKCVLSFLNLADWTPPEFVNYSYRTPEEKGTPSTMGAEAKSYLEETFHGPNHRLVGLLGSTFRWPDD